jgi:hypothetical protein
MTDLVAESYDGGQYRLAGSFSPNPAKSPHWGELCDAEGGAGGAASLVAHHLHALDFL